MAVQPVGGPVAPLGQPTTVRLEVRSSTPGARASVTYQGDQGSVTETVTTPWAVEGPITAQNKSVRLRATDAGDGAPSTTAPATTAPATTAPATITPTFECRIALDGVPVELQLGQSSVSCGTSPYLFYDTVRSTDGAPLGPVTSVTPTADPVPSVPTRPSRVAFEAGSSPDSTSMRVRFGTSGDFDKPQLENQATPWAREAALQAGVRSLTMSVTDTRADLVRCQLRVDGVLVAQSLDRYSVYCDTTLPRRTSS